MKNVVECYKEFFGYFNALETNGDIYYVMKRALFSDQQRLSRNSSKQNGTNIALTFGFFLFEKQPSDNNVA